MFILGGNDHYSIILSLRKTLKDETLNSIKRQHYTRILEYMEDSFNENVNTPDDIEDPNIRPFGR